MESLPISPSLGEEERQRLRSANEDLRRGVAKGNPDQCVEADDDFHHVFIAGSSNAVLFAQLEQVMPVLRRAEYLHFDSVRAHASITQHEEIIATVEKGDAPAAADLTRGNWMSLGG